MSGSTSAHSSSVKSPWIGATGFGHSVRDSFSSTSATPGLIRPNFSDHKMILTIQYVRGRALARAMNVT